LTIEDNNITVDNVSFDLVTILQLDLASALVMAQVDALTSVSNDILGSRMLVGTVADELLQLIDVESVDSLREGKNTSSTSRDTYFIQGQVRVTGDDSTCP
jgi:hypothetical protein